MAADKIINHFRMKCNLNIQNVLKDQLKEKRLVFGEWSAKTLRRFFKMNLPQVETCQTEAFLLESLHWKASLMSVLVRELPKFETLLYNA